MNMKLSALLGAALLAFSTLAPAVSPPPPPPPPNVHVKSPWIRWLPANLPAGGYAVIENGGDAMVRLVVVSSPDYGMAMLHQSRLAQGDSTMVQVDHLDIPAHGSVKLAPGGYHVMFMHAAQAIKPGDKVPVTLRFASGATLQVDFSVLPANASGPPLD